MNAEEKPAIRIRHLWHRFAGQDVLKDVTFDVAQGEIFGFIGPNGAGKTTTIRLMATLLEPMAGRIEIDGLDVAIFPKEVRRVIGYMPDHAGVYDRITVREYLEFFADAFRVESSEVVRAVMELTDLEKLQDKLVSTMSKGMKQRLQLARVLLHDPKILILDEPASDLDPRARIEIRDLLVELRGLGKTILLSSHILTELADVCTSVAILEQGRIVVAGPIREIAQRLGQIHTGSGGEVLPGVAQHRIKVRVLGSVDVLAPLLQGAPGVAGLEYPTPQVATIAYTGDEVWLAGMIRHLVMSNVPIIGIEPERTELERVFLEATRGDLQ